jgi:hypothetical protein
MADERHIGPPDVSLPRGDGAPERRADTHDIEELLRHRRDSRTHWLGQTQHRRRRRGVERGELRYSARPFLHIPEVRAGEAHSLVLRAALTEAYETVGIRVRQGSQQHAIHHRKDRRRHPDADRDCQYRDDGIHRRAPQRPRREPQVPAEVLDQPDTTRPARLFLDSHHPSEFALRQRAGFGGRQAAPDVVVDFHGEMELQLLVELLIH